MNTLEIISTTHCPNCNHEIPKNVEYVTWCSKCTWNYNFTNNPKPITDQYEAFILKNKMKKSTCLYKSINKDTLKKRTAYLKFGIAIFLSVITLLAFTLPLLSFMYFIFFTKFNIISLVLLLLFAALTGVLLPKYIKPKGKLCTREKSPELFSLTDQITKKYNFTIHKILLTSDFTISIKKYGIIPKRYLSIGIPLFNILNEDEIIVAITREATFANKKTDTLRFIIKTAVDSIEKWQSMFVKTKDKIVNSNTVHMMGTPHLEKSAFWRLITIPADLLLYLIRLMFFIFGKLIIFLAWDFLQLSEYQADKKTNDICQTKSILSYFFKQHLEDLYTSSIIKCALNNINLFDHFLNAVNTIPESEKLRVQCIIEKDIVSISPQLPPTLYRTNLLKNYKHIHVRNTKINANINTIKNEIKQFSKDIEQEIKENHLYKLAHN